MRDNRVLTKNTADHIASVHKMLPLFIFKGGSGAKAVYMFGRCIFSKGWES